VEEPGLLISQDTIDQVRERTDIVAVVTEAVPSLKKRGRSWVGLCPFHKEKSPSFHVNPERGFFHCFGCKESGSVIDFSMKQDGYTFPEAVRALAERLGVEVKEEGGPVQRTEEAERKRARDDLYAANQVAATFFERQLREHPQRQVALDELAKRELTPTWAGGESPAVDEALQALRIGYAPPAWDGLAVYLRAQGISPVVAEQVGLLVPRSSASGHYDRFRNRLMFAVSDPQGRVIAFSGRALPDAPGTERKDGEKPAKYINSPESPIYTKGHGLFGLHQARSAIRSAGYAVVVEGNFDLLALVARGIPNVVASLGTAFTAEQATLLKRFAGEVVLLFDADAAGKKATAAARDACKKGGLSPRVATIPSGKDPDEFIRAKGVDAVKEAIANARAILEWLLEAALDESFAAVDAHGRAARLEYVARLLTDEDDPLVRSMGKAYADKLAGRLDLAGSPETARSAPQVNAFEALERSVKRSLAEARARASAGSSDIAAQGPRDARIAPQSPGRVNRAAIVGGLLDFPALLKDPEVEEALALLEGASAQTVAALAKSLRVDTRGEIALDTSEFLAQIPPAIQDFARKRLAAPQSETLEAARSEIRVNARLLRTTVLTRETSETAHSIQKVEGDWETVADLAREAQGKARRKHDLPSE